MSSEPNYPQMITPVGHTEPSPRRVRAVLNGQTVLDTMSAIYVWESPAYPQYYIPIKDVRPEFIIDEQRPETLRRGKATRLGLKVGDVERPSSAHLYTDDNLVRFDWAAFDSWYEEDEEIFVHPRNPYARVDSLRSNRRVRIELDGVVLAESTSSVMVFETGLPTRYYLDRTDLNYEHLIATDTITACPYKGRTSGYWSVRIGEQIQSDLAWTYAFPTRELQPIAGLVAFYNEKVDIFLDDELLERPQTHFSK
jgi:uncharacterized protein (DUF427 family)